MWLHWVMRAVGIRELKDKLSHYVRLVEAGESVLVTDRGKVVAELRAPGTSTAEVDVDPVASRLAELARRGRAVLGAPHDPALYGVRGAALPDGAVEKLLDAERGVR
jgi:antitoxin (DNA-binding transcriptional repressor) of toxin-antitoxin stability system